MCLIVIGSIQVGSQLVYPRGLTHHSPQKKDVTHTLPGFEDDIAALDGDPMYSWLKAGIKFGIINVDRDARYCSTKRLHIFSDIQSCIDLSNAAYYSVGQFPNVKNVHKYLVSLQNSNPTELFDRNNNKAIPDGHLWHFQDGTVIVAFRGTSTLKDLRYDVKSSLVPTENGGIHKGFYKKLIMVEVALMNGIRRAFALGIRRIILTGHSMGGALATIAACIIRGYYPYLTVGLITFASPKVGDAVFATTVQNAVNYHFRLVNENDPVPSFPRNKEFHHVPGKVYHLPEFVTDKSKSWISRRVAGHKLETYSKRMRSMVDTVAAFCLNKGSHRLP